MALSYGGITLTLSTAELDALQETYMRRDMITEFESQLSPPYNLGHLPFNYNLPPSVKDLGRLYWPRSASRFAFAHFAVSDRIMQLIRPLAYAGGTLNALTLLMSDGSGRSISTAMYMLPPRPISQIASPGVTGGQLWQMTLVDDRYFWWYRSGQISVNEGVTTWSALYAAIASALSITLNVDAVDADYGMPTRRFTSLDQPLPVLLDAVAASVGQQIVRPYSGIVEAQNYSSAKTDFDANYADVTNRSFGGKFYTVNSGSASGDMFALVPETVRVVFPVQYIESGEVSSAYGIENDLTTLAIPDYPNAVAGFAGTQTLWGDQFAAISTGGGVPTNLAELQAYAAQLSTDWYKWQLGGTDVVYGGLGDWQPEGITDSIEILYDAETFLTRVQRAPWNDRAGGGYVQEDPEPPTQFEIRELDGFPYTRTQMLVPIDSLTDNLDGTVTMREAGEGQTGLVNHGPTLQSFGGPKRFAGYVHLDNQDEDSPTTYAIAAFSDAVVIYNDVTIISNGAPGIVMGNSVSYFPTSAFPVVSEGLAVKRNSSLTNTASISFDTDGDITARTEAVGVYLDGITYIGDLYNRYPRFAIREYGYSDPDPGPETTIALTGELYLESPYTDLTYGYFTESGVINSLNETMRFRLGRSRPSLAAVTSQRIDRVLYEVPSPYQDSLQVCAKDETLLYGVGFGVGDFTQVAISHKYYSPSGGQVETLLVFDSTAAGAGSSSCTSVLAGMGLAVGDAGIDQYLNGGSLGLPTSAYNVVRAGVLHSGQSAVGARDGDVHTEGILTSTSGTEYLVPPIDLGDSGGTVTGITTVPNGGTGVGTLPAGQVIIGAGTSPVESLSGTRNSGENLELDVGTDRWIGFTVGSF